MDGVLKPYYYKVEEQRMVPKKQNTRSKSISNACDINVAITHAGLMNNPPSLLFYDQRQRNQQPPLLPLPTNVSRQNMRSCREIISKQRMREEVKKKATTRVNNVVSFRSTENVDFESWVFNLSPPPSSLPVPKFCMRRSNLTCNAKN